ncbi:MAG: DUF5106 domain-containing protein [Bacteroidales bacterium]|nr:DUF5106 domain-containing protein [Bacteroidales bacterium]
MNVKHYFLVLALVSGLTEIKAQDKESGYSIQVEIQGISDTTLILAHRYGDKFFTDDTLRLNSNGIGAFNGEEQLLSGMYQIVFPDKSFFDFFIEDNQHFLVKTKLGSFIENNISIGNRYNQLFFDWHRASAKYRNTSEMKIIWDTTLQSAGESLVGKFLVSLRPFSIPEHIQKQKGFSENQLAQYHYYKDHFFDNTDLSDSNLLRTPVIYNKLKQFFSKVAPPQPDSLAYYADLVLDKTSGSPEVFRYTLQFLLNYYSDPKIMGTDAVYVHLAEKYYLSGKADWIDDDNLKHIANRVKDLKPLLIGRSAPLLKGLMTPEGQPVNPFELGNKWTVLYFWEPDCGHCKTSTPELHKDYDYLKSVGAEIFAINTRHDIPSWNAFIAEHELSWINLYSPSNIRGILENYQAWSTPLLFIIDSNMRIIAKDLSVSQVKDYIEHLHQQKN